MKKIVFLFLAVFLENHVLAQNNNIEDLIREFKSCDWQRWDNALYQIVDFSKQPKEGLWIPIIKPKFNVSDLTNVIFEYVVVNPGKRCNSIGTVTEGYDEFRVFLLSVMGGLTEDRMLPYLFEYYGTGTQISFVLLGYGEKVIDPILIKMKEGYSEAPWTLGEILRHKTDGYSAQGTNRKKIKEALMSNLAKNKLESDNFLTDTPHSEDSLNFKALERRVIIEALAKSGDADVIPILEDFSKNDPYKKPQAKQKILKPGTQWVPQKQIINQEENYPVREAAQKALEELKKKGVKYE